MTSYRLPAGGRIERSAAIGFRFDGHNYSGHPGDTLASALLANNVRLMGRSFKYHRARGVLTAGSAEPNALVTIGAGGRREPNARATMIELSDGLVATSQNRWPSLGFDLGAVNGLVSPFLAAGFYYKTFMVPPRVWERFYEPLIRRAAGLGRAGQESDPDVYEKTWAHCDLLIVGAGPAGLAAALTAARAGAQTIVVDEGAEAGGALLYETAEIGGRSAEQTLADMLAELATFPNFRLLARTTAIAWYDDMVFAAVERVSKAADSRRPVERLWRIVAKRALLATGSEERPLVFGDNDRPGVMLAEAALAYARRYGVSVGRRAAVFTTHESGLRTAKALLASGVEIVETIDARRGAVVVSTSGARGLKSCEIEENGKRRRLEVDVLLMSGGYSPRIHLACQRGGKPRWSDADGAFLAPECGLPFIGSTTLSAALRQGATKAAALLGELGRNAAPAVFGRVEGDWPEQTDKPLWRIPGSRGKAFVDFQNDVQVDDIALAVREGYDHVELAKRYTTNGMATDQGKLSNLNAVGLLAQARGVSPEHVGMTTFRPFYTPVSFGALAGPHRGADFQPVRRSPLEGWARRRGAVFVEAGLWMRSSYFPQAGETHWRDTVDREALAVRRDVGLCDVSTLGKIEIVGPDAGLLLDRIYCNGFAKLPVGRARYGLMLREDGFVFDDGTTSRLDEQRYVMTTTTAAAADALRHVEFCAQVLWPELRVRVASVTDQWAQMALAGPRSRELLQAICDADLSNQAFPHMSARSVTLMGGRVAARLFRISYSGELAYEIATPAGDGELVAEALCEAGASAYGLEAMGVLRIEKGHVTHNEINGTTTAADIGMGRMVSSIKSDFIGRRMLAREGLTAPDRARLVGLLPTVPQSPLRAGAHVLREGDDARLENDQGHVTSGCYSPHLKSHIALALVKRGESRHGETVRVWNALLNEFALARIVAPVFVDPAQERLNA